ncbi:uncharacterized protein EMH_0057150 [Eimeria mitis]|uniref:Uncharacterized protein n=1 Tax=Eimeria mitis TaxID=44415 RepID=U6K1Z9_9EIME|nr:uncharacterized protein EMH_0057150 [Eimeria mitis]CDJ30322.1 hypothetical protein, conserved [Eimeria mitis]
MLRCLGMAHSAKTADLYSVDRAGVYASLSRGVMMSRLIKRLVTQHRLLQPNELHARTAITKARGLSYGSEAAAAAAQQQQQQQTEALQTEICKHLNYQNLIAASEEHGEYLSLMQRTQYEEAQQVNAQPPLRWFSFVRLQDGKP